MNESNEKSEISTQEQQEPVKLPTKRGRKPSVLVDDFSVKNVSIPKAGQILEVKESDLHDRITQLEKVVVKLSSIMGMSHLTKSMREEV